MNDEKSPAWAYAALLAAMLISSGNFLLANLAVQEIEPLTLTFWRNALATACVVPFALRAPAPLADYFRRQKIKVLLLTVTGVILPAWFMYISLRSDDLIDLSVGYTFIPLMAVLFSALLLAERLSPDPVSRARNGLRRLAPIRLPRRAREPVEVRSARGVPVDDGGLPHSEPLSGAAQEVGHAPVAGRGAVRAAPPRDGASASRLPRSGDRRSAPLDYSWPVWGSIAFIGIGIGMASAWARSICI